MVGSDILLPHTHDLQAGQGKNCEVAPTSHTYMNILTCAYTHTHTHTLDYITRQYTLASDLAYVHKVIIYNDIYRAWELSSWCLLRHLLDTESLMVFELGKAVLCLQRMSIIILGRVGRACWERLQRCQVTVLPLYCFSSGRAVVDTLYHLWMDEGTCNRCKELK